MDMFSTYSPGKGLPRQFYLSDEIFAAEQQKIFRNNWFFAGHTIELPKPGGLYHARCRRRASSVPTIPGHIPMTER